MKSLNWKREQKVDILKHTKSPNHFSEGPGLSKNEPSQAAAIYNAKRVKVLENILFKSVIPFQEELSLMLFIVFNI